MITDNVPSSANTVLVLGATGKTGRRVAELLSARGVPVRSGSRSAAIPFDWSDRATWAAALAGIDSVYLSYQPDLAVPGVPADIKAFTAAAVAAGVRKIVLLSGRGEPQALECEAIVRDSGLTWTIVRCAFFAQNFDEGAFAEFLRAGELALPVGDVPEPFVDAGDIAEVAAAALVDDRHAGEVYELTGPRSISFGQAVAEIAAASGREIVYTPLTRTDFVAALTASGVPTDEISLLDYLFGTVLDGRNSPVTDGVRRALGREARDFADYAREAAISGVWSVTADA
ncbi:NAD(P)H-binding protein [Nocardia sp. CDC160]|uniref:NAD(P)H-binding protein n=1 Tax=Nocardia sp. CDC160 TaxID=3112166 RepID=UPI002DBFD5F1|nr:NAD(P)H-binding protein [Nocardia sp. CDC160]MEC3913042.1 NAD(P)H-binding protein [Nocardia sp. CDC160]